MTNVVIIDVKGLITNSGHDVLRRHVEYGKALSQINPNAKLVILSRHNVNDFALTRNIEIFSEKSLLNFFRRGIWLLQTLPGRILLVSGDPWESFLASTILRRVVSRPIPIQVQLHADVGSSAWRSLNWRNRIRSLFLSYSLKKAERIRCVSISQLVNIESILPGARFKADVVPVSIKLDPDLDQKRKYQKNVSIAIIGRVHKDRGLDEFVRICKVLSSSFKGFKILIVGEGPHEGWLKRSLQREDLLECSLFMGQKNQEELSHLWKTFGCVASLAPSEAFGRSARESLMYGVPVLAKRSSGLSELEDSFGRNGIWFLDGLSDNQVRTLFDDLTGFVVPKEVTDSIINEIKSLHSKLAKTWIDGSMLLAK